MSKRLWESRPSAVSALVSGFRRLLPLTSAGLLRDVNARADLWSHDVPMPRNIT